MKLKQRKNRKNNKRGLHRLATPTELTKLGIPGDFLQTVPTMEDLRNMKTNVVIGECLKSAKYTQHKFYQLVFNKKSSYVMGLGSYQQLLHDNISSEKLFKPSKIKFQKNYKPYNGQDLNNKSILIFTTGGIKELLFIKPSVQKLKNKYPNSKIIFACSFPLHQLVQNWDFVDSLVSIPFHVNTFLDVDYHCVFEGLLERCESAKDENIFELHSKWIGLTLNKNELKIKEKPIEEYITRCKKILDNWKVENFIFIQLRGLTDIHTMKQDTWKKIINNLTSKSYKIILTDEPLRPSGMVLKNFIENLERKDMVFDYTDYSRDFNLLSAIISLSSLVISTESASLHLAGALNVKGFGIYGPVNGENRISSYSSLTWKNHNSLDCSPCFDYCYEQCKNTKNGQHECYEEVDPEDITNKVLSILGGEVNEERKET